MYKVPIEIVHLTEVDEWNLEKLEQFKAGLQKEICEHFSIPDSNTCPDQDTQRSKPMRNITDHIVDGDLLTNQLSIEVRDEPGAGGANHAYVIVIHGTRTRMVNVDGREVAIDFQNGAIKEHGVNGVTHEALLAIVIDRLRSFQQGPFACQPNQQALDHIEAALVHLQERTRARIARGVEGTHVV